MASNVLAQFYFAGNARQSRSRGAYGRPKTRSPFPSTCFMNGGMPHQSRKLPEGIHNGARWEENLGQPQGSLNIDMCVVGSGQLGKQRLREIPASQSAAERVRNVAKNARLKLISQPHPHQHFASITPACLKALPTIEKQGYSEQQNDRTKDIESSYKLTFYNPSAPPRSGNWTRPTLHNNSAPSAVRPPKLRPAFEQPLQRYHKC